jgi:proteasome lid subunit RPN8/RPN11
MNDIVGIARETLQTAVASSEDSHPRKFVAHLRATEAEELDVGADGKVLTEIVFAPESKPGDTFDVLGVDTLPRRSSIVGTVASAPSEELESEDYTRFTNRGRVHVVVFPPYDEDSWRAYNSDGADRELDVFDVDFSDDEGWFGLNFEFTR